MTEPLIRVESLHKHYETQAGVYPVLQGIDLAIGAGEFVAVTGPSGSGKSTFMNILGCLDTPSSGRYLLDGQDTARLDSDRLAGLRNRLIGFVFQGFNLLPRVDLIDNVALPLLYAGLGVRQRRSRAAQLLERVGLAHVAHHLPGQISGGQQQRVAIARALANHPRLILADEPTGNLDTHTSREIMEIFAGLNDREGITLVVVTHEADVARFARRLVRFLDGRIEHDGEVRRPAGVAA
ncbi:MAG TPA: ABC transporter ATP-binding protein [Burkholderiales bacterium]|nr:ABC transporter ATP-binding protein [Burkholderiales bacterium]